MPGCLCDISDDPAATTLQAATTYVAATAARVAGRAARTAIQAATSTMKQNVVGRSGPTRSMGAEAGAIHGFCIRPKTGTLYHISKADAVYLSVGRVRGDYKNTIRLKHKPAWL